MSVFAPARTKARRKPNRNRREAAGPRDARVMEEIKSRRYLAFVRAIVNGAQTKGPGSGR